MLRTGHCVVGWAMQQVAFMFLDRKWDHDRKVMTQLMNHYSDLNVNMQASVLVSLAVYMSTSTRVS